MSLSSSNFTTTSDQLPLHDGVKFFTKRWTPTGHSIPRALITFLHGFAEHVSRYDHVWPLFTSRGFEVFGYDQRGFGRTEGRYGDTTLEQAVADLEYVMREQKKVLNEKYENANVPMYLYGHSMDKEFKSWPGMLHEGHNERAELRDPFLEYSIRWLERRAPV